ncbi:TPA: ABC-three component system middle component 2 [Vibrio parahaemolyticus]
MALILTVLDEQRNIEDLVKLDYSLLYSEDFGGPSNLHPALPNHVAEIAHRREVLPSVMSFLLSRGLVTLVTEKTGYYYKSNEQTLEFVSCLQANYYRKAWLRLNWMKKNVSHIVEAKVYDLVRNNYDN